MVKNSIGGNRAKKKKAGSNTNNFKRPITYKEPGQEYAKVVKILGGPSVQIEKEDGTKLVGHIRGALYKKVFLHPGDLVLISMREFSSTTSTSDKEKVGKADILHVYKTEEMQTLQSQKEIAFSETLKKGSTSTEIVFDDAGGDDSGAIDFVIDDI